LGKGEGFIMKLLRKVGRLPAVAAMALLSGLEKRERERILQERLNRHKKEIEISRKSIQSTRGKIN
jgi:hypothetical protein